MKTGPDGGRLPESFAELVVCLQTDLLATGTTDASTRDDLTWRLGWNAAMRRALQLFEAVLPNPTELDALERSALRLGSLLADGIDPDWDCAVELEAATVRLVEAVRSSGEQDRSVKQRMIELDGVR